MSSRFEQGGGSQRIECENCGETGSLLRCSRCHNAWFCSLKCHKSYWPFHKPACRPNEFADAVEPAEPKFASWMRGHGKLAVIKDDEVERLERASKPGGWGGMSRQEVMESMYGLLEPKPKAPSYSLDELMVMQQAAASSSRDAAATSSQQPHNGSSPSSSRAWQDLAIPEGLGLDCGRYKWRQTLSHVEVFVQLPGSIVSKQVQVQVSPRSLAVLLVDDKVLGGALSQEVKAGDSTWFVDADAHILHISLLKRNRKGHYANGCTNADTYWRSLLRGTPDQQLPAGQPPMHYYLSSYDADDLGD